MRIYPVWHYLHYTAWLLGVFQGVRLSTHSLDAAIYSNTATLWKTNLKQSWLPAFSVKGFVFFIKKRLKRTLILIRLKHAQIWESNGIRTAYFSVDAEINQAFHSTFLVTYGWVNIWTSTLVASVPSPPHDVLAPSWNDGHFDETSFCIGVPKHLSN